MFMSAPGWPSPCLAPWMTAPPAAFAPPASPWHDAVEGKERHKLPAAAITAKTRHFHIGHLRLHRAMRISLSFSANPGAVYLSLLGRNRAGSMEDLYPCQPWHVPGPASRHRALVASPVVPRAEPGRDCVR